MELETLIQARPKLRRDQAGWREQVLLIADRAGLSTSDLAARLGCAPVTVYAWRRLQRKANSPATPSLPARLVQVRVSNPGQPGHGTRFEVRHRSGHSVLIPSKFEPASLVAVLGALDQC